MVLDALELGVVAVMGIAVFIWGPEKIPEIAKTLTSIKKEVDGYTKQLQGLTKELQTSMNTGNFDNLSNVLTGAAAAPVATPTPQAPPGSLAAAAGVTAAPPLRPDAPPPVKTGDELLLEMAKQLRIKTAGKTRDEIQNEILMKASHPVEAQTAQAAPESASDTLAPPASPPAAA